MPRKLEIAFPESTGDLERAMSIHRVRNFAEELSLSLGDFGELPMEQADRATTKVVVSKIAKRDVGTCKQLITRLLAKHLMADEGQVSKALAD